MKKIIFIALCWPLFQFFPYQSNAQKQKNKSDGSEIIIIKNGDKEKKLTIETKDGEVFINGKPSSEYKDDDVNVIKRKYSNGYSYGFAPDAKFYQQWDGGNSAFLGVTTEDGTDGAKITDISEGSAADKAGLKEGDVITKINNLNVKDADDLVAAMNTFRPKQDVTVYYKRDGKAGEVKATLGEKKGFSAFNLKRSGVTSNMLRNFTYTTPIAPVMPREPFAFSWGFGRGRLGVTIEDTDNDTGAKITDVNDDSPAAKSGLKENDVITEVNGKAVKNVNEVRREIADVKDKNSYNIKAKRNGADMNFEIKIPKKLNKADL